MNFKILKKSKNSKARLGVIETKHGIIETPCFVPVATQAAVKALPSEEVVKTNSQALIANTYHLHIRPGERIVKKNGGLHKYMNWNQPLMTDSGGYQVFSLGFGKDLGVGKILANDQRQTTNNKIKIIKKGEQPKGVKIIEDGVWFRSYLDGKKLFLGPKESIKIQEDLGADLILAFDECPPPNADFEYNKKSMERTHRWSKTCLDVKKSKQALYGIIQGGKFKDLRIESAKFINSLPFEGIAIGGEFGAHKNAMVKMLGWVMEELNENRPRHLLGIGQLGDIEKIIKQGVDTFDCTVPTHYARHGQVFSSYGKLDLNKAIFLKDKKPLDKKCECYVCKTYTRSYLSHIYKAHEVAALQLLTFHNLWFFNNYVKEVREKIKRGKI